MLQFKYLILNPFSGILAKCATPIFALRYYKKFHRFLQLKNPTLYYDKTFWLSMNSDTTIWSQLTDKYEVRGFVEQRCGSGILNDLYGVYETPDEIEWDKLPQQFVMKTTNGCASNVFVKDKSLANFAQIKHDLSQFLKIRYGALTAQPHYSRIKPRIIVEKLLVDQHHPDRQIVDYKFNCFDGMVHSCAVFSDRLPNTHKFGRMIYDTDWKPHSEWLENTSDVILKEVDRPEVLDEMLTIASTLSQGFPYVRVDMYCIDGAPVFGEMTFTPGLAPYSIEFQRALGELIDLNKAPM